MKFFVPSLRHINLETFWLYDHCFECLDCPLLETVNFRDSLQVGDVAIGRFARSPHMKQLIMRGCNRVTDDGCLDIAKMTNLKHLELKLGNGITDVGFCSIVRACTNLTVLHLTQVYALTNRGMCKMAKKLQQLTTLYVHDYPHWDDDLVLDMSDLGLHMLEYISISNKKQPRRQFDDPEFNLFPSLKHIHLRKCCILNISNIGKCKYLSNVELQWCTKTTSVEPLSQIAHQLVNLDLTECKNIEPTTLLPVLYNVSDILENLILWKCKVINLEHHLQCENLRILSLGYSFKKMAVNFIDFFGRKMSCTNIVDLDLEGNVNISNESLTIILHKSPSVRKLNLEELQRLRDDIFSHEFLLENLEVLRISKCTNLRNPNICARKLTSIYASYTRIETISFTSSSLEVIDFSGSRYLENLGTIIAENNNVYNLWLQDIEISPDAIDAIRTCSNVEMISFKKSKVVGEADIFQMINCLGNLRKLYLNATTFDQDIVWEQFDQHPKLNAHYYKRTQ
eukprot:TRINITY_DN7454_c0_g1_i1.p1 TRINITY_DN7454_c0_g1~~TRINITY_DN7454_c0_g1_i1.p1  ORF type:complete len:570 (+),score=71.50 TRINITY_DN7454_c0_g1_i1:179-1711(+)